MRAFTTNLLVIALALLVGAGAGAVPGRIPLPRATELLGQVPNAPFGLQTLAASLGAAAARTDADCEKAKSFQSCSTCFTQLHCTRVMNKWVLLQDNTCPSSKPYCFEGKCQAAMPLNDKKCAALPEPVESNFTCLDTATRYLPDMASCTKYHICVNGTAYDYDCSRLATEVYDHKTTLCVPRSATNCFQLKCTQDNLYTYQKYSPAPWVYAVCRDTDPQTAILGTCDEGYELDLATNATEPACAIRCHGAGRIADRKDATGRTFYECADKLGLPVPSMCPAGSTFSEDKQRCI